MDGILALVLGLCLGALAWDGLIAKSTRTVGLWVEDAGVCHFDVTADAARNHQALAPESDGGLDQSANLSQHLSMVTARKPVTTGMHSQPVAS